MAALIDLTQDDLRVLRERSSVANSELVIVETADSCNRLPSGCPQTYPSQHLLMNGNKTHLPPPTRPAPHSLPFLPIYPVTYARNGSSPCLFCSPHSSQHQSRFYQVSLSLYLSLSLSGLLDQPLRWLPAPILPLPIHLPHCSQLLQYKSDLIPSLLKNHQWPPPLL